MGGRGETTRGKGDKRERHAGGRQRRRGEVDRGDRWGRGRQKGGVRVTRGRVQGRQWAVRVTREG